MNWLEYEKKAMKRGYHLVCGVDEAGRGPLAGPVYAAAVILPEGCVIDGVNDSKKLTEKKREALYDVIVETALSWCVASASVEEIDEVNILNATYLAMERAVWKSSAAPSPRTGPSGGQRGCAFGQHRRSFDLGQGQPGSPAHPNGRTISSVSICQTQGIRHKTPPGIDFAIWTVTGAS